MEQIVGKQGKTALVEKYAKVQYAKGSEVVKPSFIEVACMLHGSCLSIPKVAATLMQLDEKALNPLDSIYKLREVCIQCDKREPLQIWCFTMIADSWRRTDGRDPIPIRALGSETSESVSMVKLFLFKKQLRDYLWKEMDSNYTVWDAAIRSEIRRVTESLEARRTCLGYFNATKDSGNADEDVKALKGRAQWPASADSFLVVMEALVFSYGHDSVISQQLRNRRSIEDILNHTDIRLGGGLFWDSTSLHGFNGIKIRCYGLNFHLFPIRWADHQTNGEMLRKCCSGFVFGTNPTGKLQYHGINDFSKVQIMLFHLMFLLNLIAIIGHVILFYILRWVEEILHHLYKLTFANA